MRSEDVTSKEINSEVWNRGLACLEAEIDPQVFKAYLRPLRFNCFNQETKECEILAPSSLVRNQVDKSFKAKIERALTQESGNAEVILRLSVDAIGSISASNEASKAIRAPVIIKQPSAQVGSLASPFGYSTLGNGAAYTGRQSSDSKLSYNNQSNNKAAPTENINSFKESSGLNSRYTFSSFIVGNSNQFCNAAAMRVAEQPGQNYNPLFIFGGVGLGKTHLLHAIGNSVLARDPKAKVAYMSSETFTNELILALRNAKMDEFKQKMRSIEVLLIDDIQFISGKERTQEEFFHTFNTLYNSKHQIVITADCMPHEIVGLEDRLKTRFAWGLTADIQAPDYETRVAILNGRASAENLEIGSDVIAYIADNISSNVRELEGAFTKLHAVSSLQGSPITLDLCRSALMPLLSNKNASISIDEIKRTVADHFNIKVSDMVSKRRTKNLSFPRHIAMYLSRKHTTLSYPEIGHNFGNRDHSSVIHAANVVSAKSSDDRNVSSLIQKLEQKLMN
jgi:chromosomal replication initiator protein